MVDALFLSERFSAVTGASTSSGRLFLPPGGRLRWVSCGGDGGPVRVAVDMSPETTAETITIARGWTRGPVTQTGGFSVAEVVDLPLGKSPATPFVVAFVRNDTGATVNLAVTALAEREELL